MKKNVSMPQSALGKQHRFQKTGGGHRAFPVSCGRGKKEDNGFGNFLLFPPGGTAFRKRYQIHASCAPALRTKVKQGGGEKENNPENLLSLIDQEKKGGSKTCSTFNTKPVLPAEEGKGEKKRPLMRAGKEK